MFLNWPHPHLGSEQLGAARPRKGEGRLQLQGQYPGGRVGFPGGGGAHVARPDRARHLHHQSGDARSGMRAYAGGAGSQAGDVRQDCGARSVADRQLSSDEPAGDERSPLGYTGDDSRFLGRGTTVGEVFHAFDLDGDGSVSLAEILALASVGSGPTAVTAVGAPPNLFGDFSSPC